MGLKAIFFLGFFFAAFLLISSKVAARELAETSDTVGKSSNKVVKASEVTEDQYPGGGFGGYPGGGFGGYPGRGGFGGYPGGGIGGFPGGGFGGYPGRGGFGGYPGGGYPGGGGGGYLGGFGGEGCRFGCCGQNFFGGGGCTCCRYAGQVVDANWQVEPQN